MMVRVRLGSFHLEQTLLEAGGERPHALTYAPHASRSADVSVVRAADAPATAQPPPAASPPAAARPPQQSVRAPPSGRPAAARQRRRGASPPSSCTAAPPARLAPPRPATFTFECVAFASRPPRRAFWPIPSPIRVIL